MDHQRSSLEVHRRARVKEARQAVGGTVKQIVSQREDDEDEDELDCVTRSLIANGVPLTQRNWIEAAYLGDKHTIEEMDFEDLENTPEGFEDWPEDEQPTN
jgi:hypothetical protein